MKTTFFRILTALAAVSTFITGLGAYLSVLPAKYSAIGGLVLVGALGIKEIVIIVGDIVDDGKRNGSFKLPPHVPLILLLGCSLCLMSCATRPDGTKTFLNLDAKQWGAVGVEAGKGAIQSGLPAYLQKRGEVSAKTALDIQP